MERSEVTPFGGIAGRVVREAMSPGTLLTGACLALALLAPAFACVGLGQDAPAILLGQALVALALARFALNGMGGEWRGTLFSTAGGSWVRVADVAARYLLLSMAWILPVLLLSVGLREAGENAVSPLDVLGSRQVLTLLAVLVTGAALSPPVFLVVSVRAGSFGDLLLPSHWSRSFAGRLGDLIVLYVVYLGGLALLPVLSVPALTLGFRAGPAVGLSLAGAAAAFAGGLAVTLLGRLCGLYALGAGQAGGAEEDAREGGGGEEGLEIVEDPSALPLRVVVPEGRPSRPAAAPARTPAVPGRQPPASARLASVPSAAGRPAVGKPAAGPPAPASPKPGPPAGAPQAARPAPVMKPPLLDARRRVEEARALLAGDPEGAIRMLDDLRASHAPNPMVLHAMVMACQQAGREERAVDLAREAFPLCFQRGNVALAAEMFRALWKHAGALRLSRDQILAVAGALVNLGDLKHATTAYAVVARLDPSERRALKGLLHVADLHLRPGGSPDEALKIYRYLLHHCPNSPLDAEIRRALAEADRRLARVP